MDALDDVTSHRFVEQIVSIFIQPEVQKRLAEGKVVDPLPLRKAQVLLYLGNRPPDVRLNDEVSAVSEIVYVGNRPLVPGDPIYESDIGEVKWIQPGPDVDPNCGHISLVRISNRYHVAFDFVYNKDEAKKSLDKADQFLRTAQSAHANGDSAAAIDTLFSAAELTAKALLITNPFGSPLLEKSTHKGIRSKFAHWAKLGNVQEDHRDTFNTLTRLRDEFRYRRGPSIDARDIDKWITDVMAMRSRVGKMVERPSPALANRDSKENDGPDD
jgi:uncharacterized protein (UPF0332 family)